MNDQVLTPELISTYYREKFNIDKVLDYIGFYMFQEREFGFVGQDGFFIRNISFPTSVDLQEFMVKKSVPHAYIGATYAQPPSRDNPIQKIKWQFREFIFDLDIDEYDLVRICGCSGGNYCIDCWSLIQDAAMFIDETMREDFGFTDIRWIFSGRRGVHGWVISPLAREFDQSIRVAILDYLSFVHDIKRSQSVDDVPKEAKPLRNRIYSQIARSYFLHTPPKHLADLGIALPTAKRMIKQAEYIKEFNQDSYIDVVSMLPAKDIELKKKLIDDIILRRYPRIDRKVTMDTRRVSRMPLSIHGKTGQIAIEINDLSRFYPDSAPYVWDIVK